MKSTIRMLARRFSEPSSWAGLGALIALTGVHLSAIEVGYFINIGVGVCGLMAFFIPEEK